MLQANVTIISNKQCADMLKHNISDAPVWKQSTDFALPYGVIEQLLCTVGVPDEKTGNYSVSLSSIILRWNFQSHLKSLPKLLPHHVHYS